MSFFDITWYVKDNGTVGWTGVAAWGASATIAAGAFRRQLATPTVNNERCFVALTAGTTGGSEPSWVLTRGAKTTDNTVTWMECTGMAGTNGDITNCPQRLNSTGYSQGTVIYDPVTLSLQILSTASGNTASSAPSFSATAGVTTSDSSNIWTSLGLASTYTPFLYPHARLQNAFGTNWGVAGNTFFVSNNHAETQASSNTLIPPFQLGKPSIIMCVTDTAAPPTAVATTGSISTTNGSIAIGSNTGMQNSYFYGLNFNTSTGSSQGNISLNGGSLGPIVYESCTFKLNNTNAASSYQGASAYEGSYVKTVNCNFLFGATGQTVTNAIQRIDHINATFAATGVVPTSLINPGNFNALGVMTFRGCDLSSIVGNLYLAAQCNGDLRFQNCKIGSGVTPHNGTPGDLSQVRLFLHNCDSGVTNYRYYYRAFGAAVQHELTRVRTGGATDLTTPISWSITTDANISFNSPFMAEEIAQYNSTVGTSQTITVYLTSNTALDNSQIWLDLEILGNTGNPQSSFVSTRKTLLASATALTADGVSAWGGSALSHVYKIVSPSFTPQLVGMIKGRINVAVPSATIYVDPVIYDSSGQAIGRSNLIPGWGYINEPPTVTGSGGAFVFG